MPEPSLLALVQRLTEPAPSTPEAERRRARLLSWLHLALLLLTLIGLVVVFVFHPADSQLGARYDALIIGLIILLLAAYGLNRSGRYAASAWLTVIIGIVGPWISALLDNTLVTSDVVGLVYTVLPIFLASILLSAQATAALAVLQIAGLLLVPITSHATLAGSWPSLVTFVLFLSLLSVVSAIITRQDTAQIQRQARQLAENEALLREQSVRDALTGLFNRRYLEETMARELARAERTRGRLGVMIIDIDHFKNVNDTYGHAVGDAVLRELSKLLQANVRGSDIACRYGGEEFVLLLPDAERETTRQRAELICAAAGRLGVTHQGQPIEPITLSVGVAGFPDDGANADTLLKAADDALYRAKRAGRNQTAVAGWPG